MGAGCGAVGCEGYTQGIATSEGSSQASADKLSRSTTGRATNQHLMQVLDSLDKCLQLVEQWPSSLDVVLDVLDLNRDPEKLKKLNSKSEIQPKPGSNYRSYSGGF